jgi:hypothetical protein
MANFLTIATSATGYGTATSPTGTLQVPVDFIFQIVQLSATSTVIYFDNKQAAGQKTLTLTHTSTASSGTVPTVANAIYDAMNAKPGGVFVTVSMPLSTISSVTAPVVVTSATYA